MRFYNTLIPYKILNHEGIQYSNCRDFNHVSRYRGLRRVVHCPRSSDRFVSLELQNSITSNQTDVVYYEVSPAEENRIDLIANKLLGSPNYGWVISYFNKIEDGYTVKPGTTLQVPKYITSLFSKGEILQNVNPTTLNLGSE